MSVRSYQQTLDFSGTIIQCNTTLSCLFTGDNSNANDFAGIEVRNFRGRAMITNGTRVDD